jgi:hypothetical protein
MSGPQVQMTGGAVLVGVGLLVGGMLAWQAYQKGAGLLSGAAQAVSQAVEQGAANVQSAWVNNVSGPFQQGQDYMANGGVSAVQSINQYNHSDYGYTGEVGGQIITDGEWYSDAQSRRYDAEQLARGATPAATSNNGAAFGVYPRAF